MKKTLLPFLAAVSLASAACSEQTPDHKVLVLKNREGAAILGYDAVAYFTDNKAAKGNPKIQSEYEGAKYYFASAEHKAMFDANPQNMLPPTAATAVTRQASTVFRPSVRSRSRLSMES